MTEAGQKVSCSFAVFLYKTVTLPGPAAVELCLNHPVDLQHYP